MEDNLQNRCDQFLSKYQENEDFLTDALETANEKDLVMLEPKVIAIQYLLQSCIDQGRKSFLDFIQSEIDEPQQMMEVIDSIFLISKYVDKMKKPPQIILEQSQSVRTKPKAPLVVNSSKMTKDHESKAPLQKKSSTIVVEKNQQQQQNSSVVTTSSKGGNSKNTSAIITISSLETNKIADVEETKAITPATVVDHAEQQQQEESNFFGIKHMMKSVVDVFTPNPQSGSKPGTQRASENNAEQSKETPKSFNPLSGMGLAMLKLTRKKSLSSANLLEQAKHEQEEKEKELKLKLEEEKQKKQLEKLKQIKEQYESEFSLKTASIHFIFQDPKQLLELTKDTLQSLPRLNSLPPDASSLKNKNISSLKHKGNEYFCIGGPLYEKLLKAFFEVILLKGSQEVEYVLKAGKQEMDICCKIKMIPAQGVIIGKLRIIKNLKKHEFFKALKQQKHQSQKAMQQYTEEKLKQDLKTFIEISIKAKFRGPQICCSSVTTWKDQDGSPIIEQELISTLLDIVQKKKETGKDQISWLNQRKNKFILAAEVGSKPYILNPSNFGKIFIDKYNTDKIFWDYLDTFKPPKETEIWKVAKLDPKSIEYRYVAYKWASTFHGSDKTAQSVRKILRKLASEGKLTLARKILMIQKIYHREMYEQIHMEMMRTLINHNTRTADDIFRHLFYGSHHIEPSRIYQKVEGFDIGNNQDGSKKGIYLSDNSQAAHMYAFKKDLNHQVFLCLTIKCSSVNYGEDGNLSSSSYSSQSQKRSDLTTIIEEKGRIVINDYKKVYPGYLITYQ